MINAFSRVSTINLTQISLLRIVNTYGHIDIDCRKKNEVCYAFLQSGDKIQTFEAANLRSKF